MDIFRKAQSLFTQHSKQMANNTHPPARLPGLDIARGTAMMAMIAYHACYDLTLLGMAQFEFKTAWFWLGARAAIVSAFIFVAGVSLVLAHGEQVRWAAFARRWAALAGCAALVSLGSWLVVGKYFIYFGILHFLAVASVVAIALLRLGWWNALLAALALGVGLGVHLPWFDAPAWSWLGLGTRAPATEDFVPLLPWLGVMLVGMAAAPWLSAHLVAGPPPVRLAWLAWLGRHGLWVYMLHQPILLAALYWLRG